MNYSNFTYRLQPKWEQLSATYSAPEWSKAVKDMALTGQRICPKALEIARLMSKINIEVFPLIVPAKSPNYNFLMYAKNSGAYYFKGSRDDFAAGSEVVVNGRFISLKIIQK